MSYILVAIIVYMHENSICLSKIFTKVSDVDRIDECPMQLKTQSQKGPIK